MKAICDERKELVVYCIVVANDYHCMCAAIHLHWKFSKAILNATMYRTICSDKNNVIPSM